MGDEERLGVVARFVCSSVLGSEKTGLPSLWLLSLLFSLIAVVVPVVTVVVNVSVGNQDQLEKAQPFFLVQAIDFVRLLSLFP